MEAVRSNHTGALIASVVFVLVLAATVALQQIEIKRGKHAMAVSSHNDPSDDSLTAFQPTGESPVSAAVKSGNIQIGSGSIDCQLAADGKCRVSWQVVDRPGVDSELMEVKISEEGGVLHVEDKWHGAKWGRKPDVRVTAWLPKDTALSLALGNGDVSSALSGELSAAVGNGDLNLTGAPTSIDVSLGNGRLRGSAMLASGDSNVRLGNGDVELELLKGSDAKVEATTALGRVKASGIDGQLTSQHWTGGSYTGQVGSGAARLVLEVGNGDVKLRGAGA
jgi:hypothetical protein